MLLVRLSHARRNCVARHLVVVALMRASVRPLIGHTTLTAQAPQMLVRLQACTCMMSVLVAEYPETLYTNCIHCFSNK